MADITEVVHKISYEVNDDALQNATKAIQQQITELEKLNRNLQRYKTQLANTSRSEVQAIEQLGRKIEETNSKIASSSSKLEGVLKQVGNAVLKEIGANGKIDNAVETFTASLISEFKKVDKFDFKSIGGLATNLLSFTNIAPLAISFLINLATKLFDTSKAASEAEQNYQKFLDKLNQNQKQSLRATDAEVNEAQKNIETIETGKYLDESKKGAAQALKSKYPTIYIDYSIEDILGGKAKSANDFLLNQIEHFQKSKKFDEDVLDLQEQLRGTEPEEQRLLSAIEKAKEEISEYQKLLYKRDENGKLYNNTATNDLIKSALRDKDRASKLYDIIKKQNDDLRNRLKDAREQSIRHANYSPDLSFPYYEEPANTTTYSPNSNDTPPPKPDPKELKPTVDFTPKEPTDAELKAISDEIVQLMVNDVQEELDRQLQDVDGIELWMLKNLEEQYQKDEIKYEEYEQRKTDIKQHHAVARLKLEEAAAKKVLDVAETDEQKRTARFDLDKATYNRAAKQNESKSTGKNTTEEEEEKKFLLFKSLTDEQRINILEGIEGYQQLAQAAADAYNTILEAQIAALDREISIREKRVTAATKLAEKGNTEVLRIEEQRLREAQKKREEAARKQILVNRALAISSSIAAVANAALAGDGYTAAARVIAIVAALAAGIAQVAALAGDSSPAFKDGVVDYKGKGGPKDDKNWVRISAGESVITADGTTKNRALLEAINNGASFQMLDAPLPLFIPHFKQPNVTGRQQYASAKELNGLSDKLDKVVDAIEDNKLRQNIFFDEHGVGIMTERAISKNRKRWK